jgi:hypothetical protein
MRIPSLLAVALLACSSSEESSPSTTTDTGTAATDSTTTTDTATSDTMTSTDTTTTTDTPSGKCDFVGTWALEKFECDTMDITSSWKMIIPSTTLVITAGATGCHVVLTNKSTSCDEEMQFDWTVAMDGNITSSVSPGITKCDPMNCTFTTGDAPCKTGDRASDGGVVTGETSTLTKSGGKLILTVNKMGDICMGKPQKQTYAAK